MAHIEQQEFFLSIKNKYQFFFEDKFVLDIGSLDLNGSNKDYFTNCNYLGVDISVGSNVDIISKGHEINLPDSTFDVIVSSECFEHDMYYKSTIRNIYRMLKPGGLFIFSCATTGRPEHGTRRTTPEDAPFLQNYGEWFDYYKNLTEQDIKEVMDIDNSFSIFEFKINEESKDLYFFGFKVGDYIENYKYSFLKDNLPKIFIDDNKANINRLELVKIINKENKRKEFLFETNVKNNLVNIKICLPEKTYSIDVKSLKIVMENNIVDIKEKLFSNAFSKDENKYFFDVNNPELYVNNLEELDLKNLVFDYEINFIEQNIIKDLNSILNTRDESIKDLNSILNTRDESIKDLNSILNTRDEAIQNLEFKINDFLNSNSWRYTKPIRSFKEKVNKIKQIYNKAVSLCKIHGCIKGFLKLLNKIRKNGLENSISFMKKKFSMNFNQYKDISAYFDEMSKNAEKIDKPIFDVVIPSYNDYKVLCECVESILKYSGNNLNNIYICDDKSNDIEHINYLKTLENHNKVNVVYGDINKGFSSNVNRGLKMCQEDNDIFLLNSDVIVSENWSNLIQYLALSHSYSITGARLLYPDGLIQHGGGMRNFGAKDWFDHKYRMYDKSNIPSMIDNTVLFSTGALLYITNDTFKKIGYFDENFLMGFEDVDYCLRSWNENLRVGYCNGGDIIHKESVTRGKVLGEREKKSQKYFWEKYKNWFTRNVLTKDGKIKIVFVTQDVGIGGGHRVIFTFANHLSSNNFDVELWNLEGEPTWFKLNDNICIRKFDNYDLLKNDLEKVDCIKVATWWETAEIVWLASLKKGLPVYLVQDIESSYYREHFIEARKVESKYKPEFNYIANYNWLKKVLAEDYRLPSDYVGLGIKLEDFFIDSSIKRNKKTILVAARSEPIKNFEYSKNILNKLILKGFKVIAFGFNEKLAMEIENVEFHKSPNDNDLRMLYNRAEFFIQTSIHEGFSLPPLEAMACGCIPIVTDAFGNREYIHEENVLLIEHDKIDESVQKIIDFSLDERSKERLKKGMLETAKRYDINLCLDRLINVLKDISCREYGLK